MTFSNVNVFRNSVDSLRTNQNGGADRIKKGGAFSPNTLEASAIMRSDLDNQWENGFIIKYQALMQNRLNKLKQELTAAYKALLDVSSVQQVRENGTNSSNTALTDVYGNMIKDSNSADGVNEAFRGLHYFEDSTDLNLYDGLDGTGLDGVPSYSIRDTLTQYDGKGNVAGTTDGVYEMRKLYVNGPALQVTNSMKVVMRTEEVPPKQTPSIPIIGGILGGSRPFIGGEKVAEYSVDVNSGGYWSTLNYLYNFAPRELKYSYPTAYSTTTEEAGTKQNAFDASGDGIHQAVLYDRDIIDTRDTKGNAYDIIAESDVIPTYNSTSQKPPAGARVKWNTSNANDGYITERSASFNIPDDNSEGAADTDTLDKRLITRRAVDNDVQFQYLKTVYAQADFTVKSDFSLAPDGAKTDGKVFTEYGNQEFSGSSQEDKIKWTYQHNGINAADIGNIKETATYGAGISVDPFASTAGTASRDGSFGTDDIHTVKAGFVNHYIVQTQDVELNSSESSYGQVKAIGFNDTTGTIKDGAYNIAGNYQLLRSTGIDGSADQTLNDENHDGIIGTDENEKLLLAGSGKIAKNFDGKFVSRQYQIKSFNGQDIATDNANINISSENSANSVIIAEYEGFQRANTMNRGMATDNYSSATKNPLNETAATALVSKIQTEINATTMVDSDWHYSQYTSLITDTATPKDSISFKQINKVNYTTSSSTSGTLDVKYQHTVVDALGNITKVGIVDNNDNFNNVTVGYRKTFSLTAGDFMTASYSSPTNPNIYFDTPTLVPKDVFIEIDAANVASDGSLPPMDIIVNGKIVSPIPVAGPPAPSTARSRVYNLKGLLQEGDNVIAAQVDYNHAYNISPAVPIENSFKLTAAVGVGAGLNDKITKAWIDGKISTDKTKNGDQIMDSLSQTSITGKPVSTWTSKIMVDRITPAFYNSIYSPPAYTVTGDKDTPAGFVSDKAYEEFRNSLNSLGSVQTVTKVKDTNSFAKILTAALNNPEYQDIFRLGLLNTNLGKTMMIKAQVSAPTGGSINATMDIQYDPLNNKFILVQNKFDASGGR